MINLEQHVEECIRNEEPRYKIIKAINRAKRKAKHGVACPNCNDYLGEFHQPREVTCTSCGVNVLISEQTRGYFDADTYR